VDRDKAIAYANENEGTIYVQPLESTTSERIVQMPGKAIDSLTFWEPME
jgi:hypothetical protein